MGLELPRAARGRRYQHEAVAGQAGFRGLGFRGLGVRGQGSGFRSLGVSDGLGGCLGFRLILCDLRIQNWRKQVGTQ